MEPASSELEGSANLLGTGPAIIDRNYGNTDSAYVSSDEENLNNEPEEGVTSGEEEFGDYLAANEYISLPDEVVTSGFIEQEPLFQVEDKSSNASFNETANFVNEEAHIAEVEDFQANTETTISEIVSVAVPPHIKPLTAESIDIIKNTMKQISFKNRIGLDAIVDQLLANKPRCGDELTCNADSNNLV